MSAVHGWAITEWAIAGTAILTFLGLAWRKVVVPIRDWWRSFKAWMARVESSLTWTETQMRPNSGSSLVDKVNEMYDNVAMLLDHDAERDVEGKRYGDGDT